MINEKINKNLFKRLIRCFVFLTLVFSLVSTPIAYASIFQPGETLEPDCAPLSPNCGVAIFSLNGQTNTLQTLVTGTAGTDFGISSAGNVHTLNLPSASALIRGLLTPSDWTLFNGKQNAFGFTPLNPANNLSELASANTALNNILPSQAGNAGRILQTDGSNTSWIASGGTGTVTSVALSLPGIFSVTGSPVTASGTLSAALVSQSANQIFASPNGVSGAPAFRALAVADLPTGIPNANLANSSISFATGTTGTDFNVSGTPTSLGGTLTLNIPNASALNRGLLTSTDWTTFNDKQNLLGFTPLNPANNLSDLASASIARTNLGLGILATLDAAPAGTLTGATLASGVTASSLTSVGTLTGLSISGGITGTTNVSLLANGAGTTGNVQIGAGGAGSATPDLFVLDTKNTAGDPTGTNGASYYNSNTNKFRCFENGLWKDCDSRPASSTAIVRKAADQSVTLSTTFVDDTDLAFAIGANESWVFRFDLLYTTGAGPDIKVAVTAPALASCDYAVSQFTATISVGATACGTSLPVLDGSPADEALPLTGSVTNGGTAGIVHFQFAQNTSNATPATIHRGSSLTAFRISGADLAEVYYGKEFFAPGTVVAIDPDLTAGVKKSSGVNDEKVLGVVTTRPGMVLGDSAPSSGVPVLVALSGRVPVSVSTENGSIQSGDYLTSSSIAGAAMKANENSVVIGQALSSYNGSEAGQVLMFVKNFDRGGGEAVLLGSISPKLNADGSDNGLSTLIAGIQSENAQNGVSIISQKIADGKQFLTNFVAARVTAIRGYFDQVFTKKIHTEQICVMKSDGVEVCVDGDQFNELLEDSNITPSTPAPSVSEEVLTPNTEDDETEIAPPEITVPEESESIPSLESDTEPGDDSSSATDEPVPLETSDEGEVSPQI